MVFEYGEDDGDLSSENEENLFVQAPPPARVGRNMGDEGFDYDAQNKLILA